jgi:drug/metabolite transporter (DMT)-like permease
MEQHKSQKKGIIYAIFSGLGFGFIGYFGMSLIEDNMSIALTTFWRFFVSSIIIAVVSRKDLKLILERPKEVLRLIFYGIVLYSTGTMTYFYGSKFIGTGLAMVIFFIFPVIVISYNRFVQKHKIDRLIYIAAIIILIGISCLVKFDGVILDEVGIGLCLLSASIYATYIIVSRNNKLPAGLSTLSVSIGCVINTLTITTLDGSFYIPHTFVNWLDILGIAVISTAIPMLLFLKSLEHISSEKASLLTVLEPLFVVFLGVIFLGEKIDLIQGIGAFLILTGSTIALLEKPKSM